MKKNKFLLTYLLAFLILLVSCESKDNEDVTTTSDIQYGAIQKEYVLIRNVDELQQSNDEISLHVDSILNGLIDVEFVSTGYKSFDLNGDDTADIAFEIIDLEQFQNN